MCDAIAYPLCLKKLIPPNGSEINVTLEFDSRKKYSNEEFDVVLKLRAE